MSLDVFHGDTNDDRKPSIVALCASRNHHFNKYTTSLRPQSARQELVVVEEKYNNKDIKQVDNLSDMLEEVLQGRAKLPSTLIFYRDGVGEGMYERVENSEISRLRAKLTEIYRGKKQDPPRITYLVVQKRHHFRSVCNQSRDTNPPAGTLVDDMLSLKMDVLIFTYIPIRR